VNPAYKHLSDRLRIGELTIPQLISLFCGLMCGLVFALYLSPFSPYLTLFIAIYIASIPTGTVLLASTTEFDAWLYLRAALHDHFTEGRYIAGPGANCQGYEIEPDEETRRSAAEREEQFMDLGAIWDF
jgi:hypothetical protein